MNRICKNINNAKRYTEMRLFGLPLVIIIFASFAVAESFVLNEVNDKIMSQNEAMSFLQNDRSKRSLPFSMNNGLRYLARMLFTQQQRRSFNEAAYNHERLHRLGKRGMLEDEVKNQAKTNDRYFDEEKTGNSVVDENDQYFDGGNTGSDVIDQNGRYFDEAKTGNGVIDENNRYFDEGKTGNDVIDEDEADLEETGYNTENAIDLDKRRRLSVNGAMSSIAEMLAASGQQRLREELMSNKQRLLGLGK